MYVCVFVCVCVCVGGGVLTTVFKTISQRDVRTELLPEVS